MQTNIANIARLLKLVCNPSHVHLVQTLLVVSQEARWRLPCVGNSANIGRTLHP